MCMLWPKHTKIIIQEFSLVAIYGYFRDEPSQKLLDTPLLRQQMVLCECSTAMFDHIPLFCTYAVVVL